MKRPRSTQTRNPFEFGRELGPGELVDREVEVAEVRSTLLEGGKLFLVGPRRYGKTSIHNVAAQQARDSGGVVLRYNVEAFPQISALITQLVADTARVVPGGIERVAQTITRLFRKLRPSVSYNPLDQSWTASLGLELDDQPVPHLAHALGALEEAAGSSRRPVGLILDEMQHLLARGGPEVERQLRAAVQEHRHLGYVFAGSDTRFLTAMTMDPARPFYRLGSVRMLGSLPRPDFLAFLEEGFRDLSVSIAPGALESLLDAADEVPYNVQQLAHHVWDVVRAEGAGSVLTGERVTQLRDDLVWRLDPLYSATWIALTRAQKTALQAVVHEGGEGLYRKEVAVRYRLSATAMKKAVDALLDRNVLRRESRAGEGRLRLEDPLFGSWVRIATRGPGR